MRRLWLFIPLILVLVAGVQSCDQTNPTEPTSALPSESAIHSVPQFAQTNPASVAGGAYVLNSGEGKPDAYCHYGSLVADRASAVITPSGNATLSCHFSGLTPVFDTYRHTGFGCYLNTGGHYLTTSQTSWTRARSGQATLICQFK